MKWTNLKRNHIFPSGDFSCSNLGFIVEKLLYSIVKIQRALDFFGASGIWTSKKESWNKLLISLFVDLFQRVQFIFHRVLHNFSFKMILEHLVGSTNFVRWNEMRCDARQCVRACVRARLFA